MLADMSAHKHNVISQTTYMHGSRFVRHLPKNGRSDYNFPLLNYNSPDEAVKVKKALLNSLKPRI